MEHSPSSTSTAACAPVDGTSVPSFSASPTTSKPIHSLVIDAGPLIKNEIPISTLLAEAEELYTIPSVIAEIRDEATRSRLQTTLVPFLKLRTPRPASVQFVTGFARRTGDLEVLSQPDIHLLALTYELECERNGGDWRLRREPNQKSVNGKPPGKEDGSAPEPQPAKKEPENAALGSPTDSGEAEHVSDASNGCQMDRIAPDENERIASKLDNLALDSAEVEVTIDPAAGGSTGPVVDETSTAPTDDVAAAAESEDDDVEDDGEGEWITPSNIKKHDAGKNISTKHEIQRVLQAALLTTDMAMRNVALRINLNLLDSTCQKITHMKTWVLRCHGCFHVNKDLTRQFCPKCGQATLTRVSCSTDSAGNFKIYLKKNFQWNNRGNVYSIPKPTHGSASGKRSNTTGGGKQGWGQELILTEDQKEYTRKVEENQRTRYRDVMDPDYLPGILTGERRGGSGKIRVGAGKNVNSKRR